METIVMDQLVRSIGNPILMVNTDGIITAFNPAAGQILDLDESDVNRPVADRFGLTADDLVHRSQERAAAISGEITIRGEGGRATTYTVSVSPVDDTGFVLLWHDISAFKQGERVRIDSERAQVRVLEDAFSRYMHPSLMSRVLGDPDILTRREQREAVVMFADLRGFTRMTLNHPPEQVFAYLNSIFSQMIEIVQLRGGLVFDIIGDELMITFNVPYDQHNINRSALITAMDMHARFSVVRAEWTEQGVEAGLGIGIHRGTVTLGHLGSERQMTYTMLGETVNIAHRLVDLARDGQIVVSEAILVDGLPEGRTARMTAMPETLRGTSLTMPLFVLEAAEQTQ